MGQASDSMEVGQVVRRSAAERRAEIIEAALRVIAREGMQGATVRAIVAEAGLPLATFHYVFESREEMIGQAYEHVIASIEEFGTCTIEPGLTVADAARAVLSYWLEGFLQRPHQGLALLEIMAYCRRTPSLEHLPARAHAHYVDAVARLVARLARECGVEETAMPPAELAEHLLVLADGISGAWLRHWDAEVSRRSIDLAADLVDAAVHGKI